MSGRPCGKLRYASERAAERELEKLRGHMKRQHAAKIVRRAYPCPKCRGWHLTAAEDHPTRRPAA